MAIFLIQRQITLDCSGPFRSILIKLICDLMVTYILTMFGVDWIIIVDFREKNVKFSNFSQFKSK